ncbi:MAG: protein kinase, partial [Thermoanaerobaculia bacterium]|nr:protein kinase [Thermoanaerobaculia bacterium]
MGQQPEKIGKYEIEGVIGEGGMGVVYKGRDPLIDRVVAIKTIKATDKAEHEELLKRLQMEAKSAGKLQHPNIVVIHDFGEQDDLTYLVMEYVEGRNLASIIKSGRQLPFAIKIDVIIQLCQGLDYAHGLGVTHRDIKPGNIAVTARGTAKILDFGLARVGSERLTKTGFTSGTIAYMSPERMRGDSGASDDIFALGAVAYEILTYQRAFPGKTYSDVVTKVLSDQYPKPLSEVANLPPELDPIILKALARETSDRYPNAGALAKELESFRNTIVYQDFAAKADEGDAEILAEDAPVSSTANPYSAGAVTPAPGAFDFGAGEGEPEVAPEPPTEQTSIRDLGGEAAAPPEGVDRTNVRPAPPASSPDSEAAIPTEMMGAYQPGAEEEDLDAKPTEMTPAPRELRKPDPKDQEKTVARPAKPV